MITIEDVLETNRMITENKLDVRTITMGISLRDCSHPNLCEFCRNIYDKITKSAEFLVQTGEEISAEYQSNFDDVYFYLFSEESEEKNLRSCHAVDLPYTFNVGDHIVPNPKQNLVKIIQKSWAAFATTGNPDNEFIPHWEKYSAENRQTMELNSKKCILHKDLNTENLNSLRYVYEN